MAAHKIILQPMDDDYVEPCALSNLLTRLQNADSEGEDGTYYCNIHLDDVSSEAPYAFVAYKRHSGYFISVSPFDGSKRLVSFIAKTGDDFSDVTELQAGEHRLAIPKCFFFPYQLVERVIVYFCDTGLLFPDITWIRHSDLGFRLYFEDD